MAHPERRPLDDAGMISRGSRAAPGQNAPKDQQRKDAARWPSPPPWSSASVAHRQSWNRSRHPGFPDRQGDPDLLFLYPPLILISDCMLIQSMPLHPLLLPFFKDLQENITKQKGEKVRDRGELGRRLHAGPVSTAILRAIEKIESSWGLCGWFWGPQGFVRRESGDYHGSACKCRGR